jgi:hypothetical protein
LDIRGDGLRLAFGNRRLDRLKADQDYGYGYGQQIKAIRLHFSSLDSSSNHREGA